MRKQWIFLLFIMEMQIIYTHNYDYDLVIVGGGILGITLAKKLVLHQKNILLIQPPVKDYTFWGFAFSVLNEKAKFYFDLEHSLGIARRNSNFFSFSSSINHIISALKKNCITHGITYLEGIPEILSSHVLSFNFLEYSFEKLLLFPEFHFQFDINNLDPQTIITPKTLFFLSEIPKYLIVIDNDNLGIEYVTLFHLLGAQVIYITNQSKIVSERIYEFERFWEQFLDLHFIKHYCLASVLKSEQQNDGSVKLFLEKEGKKFSIQADKIFITGKPSLSFNHIITHDLPFAECNIQEKKMSDTKKSLLKFIDYQDMSYIYGTFKLRYFLGLLEYNIFSNSDLLDYYTSITVLPTIPLMIHVGMTEQEAFNKYGSKIKVFRESFAILEQAQLESRQDEFIKVVCLPNGKILGVKVVSNKAADIIENINFEQPIQYAFQNGITNVGTFWVYLDILERIAYQAYFQIKISSEAVSKSCLALIFEWIKNKLWFYK